MISILSSQLYLSDEPQDKNKNVSHSKKLEEGTKNSYGVLLSTRDAIIATQAITAIN